MRRHDDFLFSISCKFQGHICILGRFHGVYVACYCFMCCCHSQASYASLRGNLGSALLLKASSAYVFLQAFPITMPCVSTHGFLGMAQQSLHDV